MISWYLCNDCGIEHMKHEVQVDHKLPVVPVTGWISWDETIQRLFCPEKDLQVLCKDCHHKKSAEENSKRKRPVRKKKAVPRLRPSKLRSKKQ